MTKTTLSPFIAVLLGLGLHVAPAQAQLARTFVSAIGNDANDCGRATPCKSFQRAHDNSLPEGEITVLDPGGYGAVTITKSISIINDGVGEAGVLVSGGLNGITINAGAADKVSLRGLTVKGLGAAWGGGNGIRFNTGAALSVENCVIRNLTGSYPIGRGIVFTPNASGKLTVSNTLVADNTDQGIHIFPRGTFSVVNAVLSRVEAYNNLSGITVSGTAASGATLRVAIVDSIAAHNTAGIWGNTVSGAATTIIMVMRSVAAYNTEGIHADATFTQVGQSILTGNGSGWVPINGAVLESFGDNSVYFNGAGESALPLIGKK